MIKHIFIILCLLVARPALGYTKAELKDIVRIKAIQYQVSPQIMEKIITCESQWRPSIQSNHRYGFNHPRIGIVRGTRERSYGLVQISLPHNPKVSYKQAVDPVFAITFLAKNLAKNKGNMWSCFPRPIKPIIRAK